jgi:hypothetical protein
MPRRAPTICGKSPSARAERMFCRRRRPERRPGGRRRIGAFDFGSERANFVPHLDHPARAGAVGAMDARRRSRSDGDGRRPTTVTSRVFCPLGMNFPTMSAVASAAIRAPLSLQPESCFHHDVGPAAHMPGRISTVATPSARNARRRTRCACRRRDRAIPPREDDRRRVRTSGEPARRPAEFRASRGGERVPLRRRSPGRSRLRGSTELHRGA